MAQTTRRKMGYWDPFNNWWREYVAQHDKRPKVNEMKKWYDANAEQAWGGTGPTWEETKKHSKGMRRIEEVSEYFREYRRGRKRRAGALVVDEYTSGSDTDPDNLAGGPSTGAKGSKRKPKTARRSSSGQGALAKAATAPGDALGTPPQPPSVNLRAASTSHLPPSPGSPRFLGLQLPHLPNLPTLQNWFHRAASVPSAAAAAAGKRADQQHRQQHQSNHMPLGNAFQRHHSQAGHMSDTQLPMPQPALMAPSQQPSLLAPLHHQHYQPPQQVGLQQILAPATQMGMDMAPPPSDRYVQKEDQQQQQLHHHQLQPPLPPPPQPQQQQQQAGLPAVPPEPFRNHRILSLPRDAGDELPDGPPLGGSADQAHPLQESMPHLYPRTEAGAGHPGRRPPREGGYLTSLLEDDPSAVVMGGGQPGELTRPGGAAGAAGGLQEWHAMLPEGTSDHSRDHNSNATHANPLILGNPGLFGMRLFTRGSTLKRVQSLFRTWAAPDVPEEDGVAQHLATPEVAAVTPPSPLIPGDQLPGPSDARPSGCDRGDSGAGPSSAVVPSTHANHVHHQQAQGMIGLWTGLLRMGPHPSDEHGPPQPFARQHHLPGVTSPGGSHCSGGGGPAPGGLFSAGSWLLGRRSREAPGSPLLAASPTRRLTRGGSASTTNTGSGSPRILQRLGSLTGSPTWNLQAGISGMLRPIFGMMSFGRRSSASTMSAAADAAVAAVAEEQASEAAAVAAAAGSDGAVAGPGAGGCGSSGGGATAAAVMPARNWCAASGVHGGGHFGISGAGSMQPGVPPPQSTAAYRSAVAAGGGSGSGLPVSMSAGSDGDGSSGGPHMGGGDTALERMSGVSPLDPYGSSGGGGGGGSGIGLAGTLDPSLRTAGPLGGLRHSGALPSAGGGLRGGVQHMVPHIADGTGARGLMPTPFVDAAMQLSQGGPSPDPFLGSRLDSLPAHLRLSRGPSSFNSFRTSATSQQQPASPFPHPSDLSDAAGGGPLGAMMPMSMQRHPSAPVQIQNQIQSQSQIQIQAQSQASGPLYVHPPPPENASAAAGRPVVTTGGPGGGRFDVGGCGGPVGTGGPGQDSGRVSQLGLSSYGQGGLDPVDLDSTAVAATGGPGYGTSVNGGGGNAQQQQQLPQAGMSYEDPHSQAALPYQDLYNPGGSGEGLDRGGSLPHHPFHQQQQVQHQQQVRQFRQASYPPSAPLQHQQPGGPGWGATYPEGEAMMFAPGEVPYPAGRVQHAVDRSYGHSLGHPHVHPHYQAHAAMQPVMHPYPHPHMLHPHPHHPHPGMHDGAPGPYGGARLLRRWGSSFSDYMMRQMGWGR